MSAPFPQRVRDNGLGLAFGALFVVTLLAESFVGLADFNGDQAEAGLHAVGYLDYVLSSAFAVDVMENWQSEFLQFLLYIVATVWLVQRGSPESKDPEDVGTESDEKQLVGRYARSDSPPWVRAGGWRTAVFSRSLGLVMGTIFVLSWLAQSIAGATAYSEEQLRAFHDPVTWREYLTLPDFWNRTLQNWQSELLAVASMVVLSIYLRQRGSPESKPVGARHGATDISG